MISQTFFILIRLSDGPDVRGKGNRSFKRSFKCFVESKLLSKSDRTLAETDQLVEKVSLRLGGKNLVGYLSSPPPPSRTGSPQPPGG
jgi:hypothetical protein